MNLTTANAATDWFRQKTNNMLLQRALVIIVLAPVALVAIYFGGLVYTLAAIILLGLAAWEFLRMFQAGGCSPLVF